MKLRVSQQVQRVIEDTEGVPIAKLFTDICDIQKRAALIVKRYNAYDDLVEALQDVLAAATGPTNDKNITDATRRAKCAAIAGAALTRVLP
jgi:hypothetical protein